MIFVRAGIDLGGLMDVIKMIKDFILSLLSGLKTLIQALAFILQVNSTAVFWLPLTVGSVIVVGCTLIIVLRVIGR